jgi:hypothetical protein
VQELSDELLVYDLECHRAHCLNRAAAHVWRSCDGQQPVRQIAASLSAELKAPVDEQVVWSALDQLERARLLEERLARPRALPKLSRRELVGQLSLAAIIAAPLVTTILAPRAQAAASCVASGGSCTTSVQCCSGVCNEPVCL